MTKQEAHNLTQSIIDYFTSLISFEHPDDIRFEIVDHPDQCKRSNVMTYPSYLVHDIQINVSESDMPLDEQVCHELAHIFLSEYTQMFYQLFGEIDNNDSPEFRAYDRASERTAMRFGRILSEMWRVSEEIDDIVTELGEENE